LPVSPDPFGPFTKDHPYRTVGSVQITTSPPPDRRLIAAAIRHKSKPALWFLPGLGILLVLAVE
jgi:hypothetical protein